MWDTTFMVSQVLGVQSLLGHLGYSVRLNGAIDGATKRAVSLFQRRHHLVVDGNPLSPEMAAATEYIEARVYNAFGLPDLNVNVSTWDHANAAVNARGTWEGGDPPRQTSDIWCYRYRSECVEVNTYILGGEIRSFELDYAILRWDRDNIVARSDAVCQRDELTIRREPAAAILMRSPLRNDEKLCQRMRTPGDDAVRRLVDGNEVSAALDRATARFYLVSGRAKALIDQWVAGSVSRP